MTITSQQKKAMVEVAVLGLLTANNTVTTLEVKTQLRISEPDLYWSQGDISAFMNDLHNEKKLTFKVAKGGGYRIYSKPTPTRNYHTPVKPKKTPVVVPTSTPSTYMNQTVSRTGALDIMKTSGGKFLTVTFTKKDNTARTMNCRYKAATQLGYVQVVETKSKAIKNVNLQTLSEVRLNGITYQVR